MVFANSIGERLRKRRKNIPRSRFLFMTGGGKGEKKKRDNRLLKHKHFLMLRKKKRGEKQIRLEERCGCPVPRKKEEVHVVMTCSSDFESPGQNKRKKPGLVAHRISRTDNKKERAEAAIAGCKRRKKNAVRYHLGTVRGRKKRKKRGNARKVPVTFGRATKKRKKKKRKEEGEREWIVGAIAGLFTDGTQRAPIFILSLMMLRKPQRRGKKGKKKKGGKEYTGQLNLSSLVPFQFPTL